MGPPRGTSYPSACVSGRSRTRPPRPYLLLLVFGAFLAIIGITATAQSALVGAHFSTADPERRDRQRRRDDAGLRQRLRPPGRPRAGDAARPGRRRWPLEAQLAALTGRARSSGSSCGGPTGPSSRPARRRSAGSPARRPGRSRLARRHGPGRHRAGRRGAAPAPGDLGTPTVIREFLPIDRRRRGPRRGRHLARRRAGPRPPRRRPPRGRHRDPVGGARRAPAAVPHLPVDPGPARPARPRPSSRRPGATR